MLIILLGFLFPGCSRHVFVDEPNQKQENSTPKPTPPPSSGNKNDPTGVLSFIWIENLQNSLTLSIADLTKGTVIGSLGGISDLGSEVRIATADINFDGTPDLILATGPGVPSKIRILDGNTATVLKDFSFIVPNQMGGLYIAACDVNGDGTKELIVGSGKGGLPWVYVLQANDGQVINAFQAYTSTLNGGVRVACGDTNLDGRAEIITGAGVNGGPLVRIFDKTGVLMNEFMAYESSYLGGIFVAAGDFTGDGKAEIITGPGESSTSEVRIFDAKTFQVISSFKPYPSTFTGGVRVAASQVSGDYRTEILIMPGPGLATTVSVFDQALKKIFETPQNPLSIAVGGYVAAP